VAPPPIDDAVIEQIHTMARNGTSQSKVARATGLHIQTVRKYWPDELRQGLEALIEAAVNAKLAKMGGYAPATPEPEPPPAAPPPLPPPGRSLLVKDETKAERTLFLSDLHVPFHDLAAWRAAMALIEDYQPQLILLAGDLFDCYSISHHDRDPGRADYLQDEFDEAQPLWQELEDRCKGATVVFWKGNHEERIDRLQREKTGLFKLRSLELVIAAEMPKRWTYHPNQTRYKLGSLSCLHGDLKGRGTSSVHAAGGMLRKLRTSCIFGHLHRFQTFYETNADGTVRAGFANGHLCDVAKAHYITNPDWQQGISTIDYDWSADIFTVHQYLIFGGKLRRNGATLGV
jgi:predicted phosphodiesterase